MKTYKQLQEMIKEQTNILFDEDNIEEKVNQIRKSLSKEVPFLDIGYKSPAVAWPDYENAFNKIDINISLVSSDEFRQKYHGFRDVASTSITLYNDGTMIQQEDRRSKRVNKPFRKTKVKSVDEAITKLKKYINKIK